MTDLGLALIDRMHRKMLVDEQWTTRTARAFSWIAHRLEQTVSTTRPIQDGEFLILKLSAESAVVDAVTAPEATVDRVLSELNRHSFGSCYSFVRSERRIYVTTSTWVHEGTVDWRSETFGIYAIGQLCFAEAEADYLADKCGGVVARRIHSISGHREVPDDMLNLLHDLIVPKGQEPSSYSSEFEFEAVVDASRQSNSVATLGSSAEGVALECSFGDYTAISILSSTSKHRLLGAGLCAWLQLPMPITPDDGHRISAMLNRHERDRGAMGGQGHIGAWCVDHGPTGRPAVTYRSFLPNFLRRAGVIMDTSMACIARMRWADQVIHTKPTTENVWSSLAKRFGLSWI